MLNQKHKEQIDNIYRIALKVQGKLGNCFTSSIYKDALEREFAREGVPCKRSVRIPVFYDDDPAPLGHSYTADFIVNGKIILMVHGAGDVPEPKAGYELITMLQATRNSLAVVLNFHERSVTLSKAYCYDKYVNSINRIMNGKERENGEDALMQAAG
ncbi:MAG: hypothetical protein Ta2G_12740 [Termitinemataceae bacterium]|nr:MAG: hypothetical protein Ta2G_07610 [Termitinemataceae bacterium]GMO54003.1 MAG: hypothetical protein Ta2G_12740 [Termitinemataceae bacterium]